MVSFIKQRHVIIIIIFYLFIVTFNHVERLYPEDFLHITG